MVDYNKRKHLLKFKVLNLLRVSVVGRVACLVLAQRGCHHDNIVVAPRLAADIPALFQILPTALLLLANTNSCCWSHSTIYRAKYD